MTFERVGRHSGHRLLTLPAAFSRRRLRALLSVAGLGIMGGAPACGDCVSIGYPAVKVAVVDATTGGPVDIGGSVLIVTSGVRRDSVDTSWRVGRTTFEVCCVSGSVRIQLQQAPYVPWDTAVVVRTSGRCDIPELVTLVARLRRNP